jgi:hypothetical protein
MSKRRGRRRMKKKMSESEWSDDSHGGLATTASHVNGGELKVVL